MKETLTIADGELDQILEENTSEEYAWDENRVIINGALYFRKSIITDEVSNKSTAQSLIKKEPEFDYSFMDDVYRIMDENEMDYIIYARPSRGSRKDLSRYPYQLDLYSAYPHVLNYERLPVDGELYSEEDTEHMNFYKYTGDILKTGAMVTDDLKNYLEAREPGCCSFLFGTDYKTGSKMGEKLIGMVYKNKKTKAEAKLVHYGYYQKKFIEYDYKHDCYARNPKYNHELLMVAILSQLAYIMLNISDMVGSGGYFVTDAYYFEQLPDVDTLNTSLQAMFPNYDYRITDANGEATEDRHGAIVYKSYPDLPDAPRSHHKK